MGKLKKKIKCLPVKFYTELSILCYAAKVEFSIDAEINNRLQIGNTCLPSALYVYQTFHIHLTRISLDPARP